MTDLPTLLIGSTDDMEEWVRDYCVDPLNTVYIDDTLPTVQPIPDSWVDDSWKRKQERPLRAGDRVHLVARELIFPTDHQHRLRIFATATVDQVREWQRPEGGYVVFVTDVEALS